jgi:RHS repeat-associated protein
MEVEVYFDDFRVEHVKSPVIQSEDFYPFGLTFNSYQRENALNNRWKFQGQEHIDDLGLNWDSFKWRNHQPDIGRFFNVDPLADKYVYNSPYAFAENKLGLGRELEGLELAPFNPQTTHPFTIIAEGFRQAFDGILSMFQGEAKAYTNTSGTNAQVNTGNVQVSTTTSTETKAFVKVDLSKVMDNNGTNKPDFSGSVQTGVKTTLSQTSQVKVTVPTPSGAPVNVSASNTLNTTDQSKANKVEVSVGINQGQVQGKAYVSNSTTVNSNGTVQNQTSVGVKAEVPVYKVDQNKTISIGIQAEIKH